MTVAAGRTQEDPYIYIRRPIRRLYIFLFRPKSEGVEDQKTYTWIFSYVRAPLTDVCVQGPPVLSGGSSGLRGLPGGLRLSAGSPAA